jgi:tripartite-type tricarboxylate transporter receptor subunit TctC
MRTLVIATLAAAFTIRTHHIASANSYPQRPIKIILPYTPGSPNDVIARITATVLSSKLGQPVFVENRPGGGTTIGLKAVMTADADGYTLLFSNTPTHVLLQGSKGFAYDPINDFVPIAMVGTTSLILVIPVNIPVKSLQEFIDHAKANPNQLNFGFGQGTLPHLVGEAFKIAARVNIESVPYRGGAQAIADMLGGRIQMNLGTGATLLPLIREGKIKALAVTSPSRMPDLPNVPTMKESGFAELTSISYYGLLGPSGTPDDVVARMNREINESLKTPELRRILTNAGFTPVGGSAKEFGELITEQLRHWAPIAQATKFQMN